MLIEARKALTQTCRVRNLEISLIADELIKLPKSVNQGADKISFFLLKYVIPLRSSSDLMKQTDSFIASDLNQE